jgi:hypothetical protein
MFAERWTRKSTTSRIKKNLKGNKHKRKKNETHRHTQCQTGIYMPVLLFFYVFFFQGYLSTKKQKQTNKQIKFDKL